MYGTDSNCRRRSRIQETVGDNPCGRRLRSRERRFGGRGAAGRRAAEVRSGCRGSEASRWRWVSRASLVDGKHARDPRYHDHGVWDSRIRRRGHETGSGGLPGQTAEQPGRAASVGAQGARPAPTGRTVPVAPRGRRRSLLLRRSRCGRPENGAGSGFGPAGSSHHHNRAHHR